MRGQVFRLRDYGIQYLRLYCGFPGTREEGAGLIFDRCVQTNLNRPSEIMFVRLSRPNTEDIGSGRPHRLFGEANSYVGEVEIPNQGLIEILGRNGRTEPDGFVCIDDLFMDALGSGKLSAAVRPGEDAEAIMEGFYGPHLEAERERVRRERRHI